MAIKVSAKTVAQLRKGTMAGNLAKAKNASPEMREALTRFYGAKRVNAAGGNKTNSGSATVRENLVKVSGNANDREGRKAGVTAPKPTGGPGSKMSGRPAGGPGAKPVNRVKQAAIKGGPGAKMSTTPASSSTKKTTGTGNTKRVNKPLVNLPGAFGNAQTKLDKKAAANKTLLAEQKKKAQANAKKNGIK